MAVERMVNSTTCLTHFAMCCLRIARLVNASEKIFAWMIRSRHEFVPLLVGKKDLSDGKEGFRIVVGERKMNCH